MLVQGAQVAWELSALIETKPNLTWLGFAAQSQEHDSPPRLSDEANVVEWQTLQVQDLL
jgi:hypothetical protein